MDYIRLGRLADRLFLSAMVGIVFLVALIMLVTVSNARPGVIDPRIATADAVVYRATMAAPVGTAEARAAVAAAAMTADARAAGGGDDAQ